MLFDYETVRFIALILIVVLIMGYLITDGFDFGAGTLLPFIAKTDEERRVIINTMAPTWEGNQTWLVSLGGALFASWPQVYATSFSGFYFGMLLLLFALFFRPVGFDFRSKKPEHYWRNGWDWGLFIGNFIPALLFGVVLGNLFAGTPYHFDENLRSFYEGGLFFSHINNQLTWGLLNPTALFFGLASTAIIIFHGAVFIQYKTEDALYYRAITISNYASIVFLVIFSLGGLLMYTMDGYIAHGLSHSGVSNVLHSKTVSVVAGGWLNNYNHTPWLYAVPLSVYALIMLARHYCINHKPGLGFLFSSVAMMAAIATAAIALFPFIMPSTLAPNQSMTIWDATASPLNMNLVTYISLILIPIVVGYTTYVYKKMAGIVTINDIRKNSKTMY